MTNMIGQSLGRYHILEQLGEGGMAIVYKAYDTRLESDVAIKVIRTEKLSLEMMDNTIKRFKRESKALIRLTNPNIVQITDEGEFDGRPYLVMSYVPGGTLKQRLGKPIPWQEAARLLVPIARALDYAHQQGIIHRDVKPSNILLTLDNVPMLADFGIAKILLNTEETSDLTGTGMGIGTPEYMSPEQFQGSDVGAHTDIYSLGVVFYEMITGKKPYTAKTPAAILVKQVTEPLPRPSSIVRNLPEAIEQALIKALAKNPDERFANMGEFLRVLEIIAVGKQILIADLTDTITVGDSYDTFETYKEESPTFSTIDQNAHQQNIPPSQPPLHPRRIAKLKAWVVGCVAGLITTILIGLIAIVLIATNSSGGGNVSSSNPSDRAIPSKIVPVSSGYFLEDCQTSNQDICLYSINPQTGSVIIALKYQSGISSSNLPYITVGDLVYDCNFLEGYPGRLYCEGESVSGDYKLTLRYSNTDIICSGTFTIPEYFDPSLPQKPGTGGGKYP